MKSRHILGISLLAFLVACSPPPEKNEVEYLTIHELCACGKITKEKIQYFLDLGVDINSKNASGETPLSLAVKGNKTYEEIRCLVELDAKDSINIVKHPIRNNNLEVAKLLVGKNVNAGLKGLSDTFNQVLLRKLFDKWVKTPYASERLLRLKRGEDTPFEGENIRGAESYIEEWRAIRDDPSAYIQDGMMDVFEDDALNRMFLIVREKNIEYLNFGYRTLSDWTFDNWHFMEHLPEFCEANETLLSFSATYGSVEMATFFIQSGATNLHRALLAACKTPNKAMIELLIRANLGDTSCVNECGKTPLHMAVLFWGTPETISLLIDAGCSVNAQDNFGATPLDDYVKSIGGTRRNHEVLIALLQEGAVQRKSLTIKGNDKFAPSPYVWQSPCELEKTPETTTFNKFAESKEFLVGNQKFIVLDKEETQIESILMNRMSPEFDKKGIPLKFIATNESFVDELLELEMRAILGAGGNSRQEFLEISLSQLNMLPYIVCADATFGKDNISEEQFQIVKEKLVVESLNTTWDSAIANARNVMADWFAEFEITDFNLSQPRVLTNGKNHITFLLNNGVEFNATDNQEYALSIVITMTMLRIEEKVLFVYTYCDSNDHASFKDFTDWLDETILNIQ